MGHRQRGDFAGVGIDMGLALGKHLGREVEFRDINFEGLITALKTISPRMRDASVATCRLTADHATGKRGAPLSCARLCSAGSR